VRRLITFGVAYAILGAPALASDWTNVPWSPNPHSGVIALQVDLDSLTVDLANQYHGIRKNFWMRRVHADGAKDLAHVTLDCGGRTYVADTVFRYDKNGATTSSYSGDFRTAPIPPDTDFDALRRQLCE
jgi:hypothetical protein